MKVLTLVLGSFLCGPALSDTTFVMLSTSAELRYGLLVAADEGCTQSRVTVENEGEVWKSATLGPGEIAVVRMGHGFAVGEHRLTVNSAGCRGVVHAARSVVLGKLSPDHGWRALGLR
jgi:hypothetical protein